MQQLNLVGGEYCKVARTRASKPLRQNAGKLRSYVLKVYVHITGLVRAKGTTVTLTEKSQYHSSANTNDGTTCMHAKLCAKAL